MLPKPPIRFRDTGLEYAYVPPHLNQRWWDLAAFFSVPCGRSKIIFSVPLHSIDKHALLFRGFKSIHGNLLPGGECANPKLVLKVEKV
jgi:hypothetical protein